MNDTMGARGLVQSLCVFDDVQRLPATRSALPTHQERTKAIESTQHEMAQVTA